ncbi:hypothetical protein GCM10010129_68610 [Streptomyces fumigatiscleroticus]|nr:hypothetical protein GCM10010129_68610 [Streptomyces fumigatiscleroticus]
MAAEAVAGSGRLVVLRGGPPDIPRPYQLPEDTADALRPVPVLRFVHSTAIAEQGAG